MINIIYLVLLLAIVSLAQHPNNQYEVQQILNYTKNNMQATHAQVGYSGSNSYYIKPISTIAQSLNVTFLYESKDELTVTILNADETPRFTLPHEYPFSYTKVQPETNQTYDYAINIQENPFSFAIVRASTNETIFDTSSLNFMYSEFFLTFGTHLPSQYLYGLGERARDFLYESGTYTIWNRDQGSMIDNGTGGAQQTYGCHPVYLMREASGKWHMAYLRTTNAMDFVFDSVQKTLQFLLTGGVIELKFFLGDENPETAIKKYHNYINGWMIQPFWSHGYHQSRWGYTDLQMLEDVVNNMTANNLPIDVIWSDIDYMVNYIDFTIDTTRYDLNKLKELVKNIHFVPIIDAGIAINNTSAAYNIGQQYNVWIDSALQDGQPLTGKVWPGLVHWPDWFNPNSSQFWKEMFSMFYDIVPFSGIWLDMNENSNFCDGECPPSDSEDQNEKLMDIDPFIKSFNSSQLPYLPGNVPLEKGTLSINGLHYGTMLEFDVHNLNGFFESMYTNIHTHEVLGSTPFLLARSTHVGSGQFTAHWTGDNDSTWDFLRVSIPSLFNFQLFGVSMVGADVCGFIGDTTVELCARWMQLGAFYPFMRNHNIAGAISQEPYALGPTVLKTSLAALRLRYSMVKFYYSVFIRNNGFGTVFRPVFFDFSNDETLLSVDSQFLIGSELMVASVGYQGLTEVGVYFPSGARWYNFFNGEVMLDVTQPAANITVAAPLNDTLPVFIKGGSIVHIQNVDNVLNTSALNNVFNLVVALAPVNGQLSQAYGQMLGISNYSDDSSVGECYGQNDCLVNINVTAQMQNDGTTTIDLLFGQNTPKSLLEEVYISNITFYGVNKASFSLIEGMHIVGEGAVTCFAEKPELVQFGTIKFEIDSNFNCQQLSSSGQSYQKNEEPFLFKVLANNFEIISN